MITIVKTIEEVRAQVKAWRAEGLTVGLVPTMGYLHEGHQSLIARSVAENDRTVVSDFVNPIQFGPTEDLATYPRDIERDAALCESTGANLIFQNPPDSFPRRLHGCQQAVPHCTAGSRILRSEGRTAAGSHPPHGA